MQLVLVLLGGALGSAARFLFGKMTLAWLGPNYPWGTLGVNLIGGFLMGALMGALTRTGGNENLRVLLAVGVLGGFTTFSSFSLDTVTMLQRGDWAAAFGYVAASVIGSLIALFAGLSLVRSPA
jgi:fluoride exporter